MFTGLIEALGRLESVEDRPPLRVFRIRTPAGFLDDVAPGDSVAVDGACLTAVEVEPERLTVEAIPQTLERTVAGRYRTGTVVNLEKALVLGTRLGGHLVQGHVDGMASLMRILEEGEAWRLHFRLPAEVHRATILHGSITLNGVSLTVNALGDPDDREPNHLEVGIIPHTWTHTNLSLLAPGDPVNVEGDLIGKYVARWMSGRDAPPGA
jgi:riboflavin synthase